ncbi:MAG: sigma-70 family RNA polymerase sigma factor [Gemmatimonadota bacterium]
MKRTIAADRHGETSGLIERARAGDEAAFEALYRGNVGRVHGLCLRMVAEQAAAEELTQDVFVRAWEKLSLFRGDSAFSTWLHRLAVNVVLQHLRSQKRREARVTLTDDVGRLAGSTRPASTGAKLDLERAMATLPEGARRVFVLHDIEGYKHAEIAEMTGTAVGTSKAQLHRARKLLKKVLA